MCGLERTFHFIADVLDLVAGLALGVGALVQLASSRRQRPSSPILQVMAFTFEFLDGALAVGHRPPASVQFQSIPEAACWNRLKSTHTCRLRTTAVRQKRLQSVYEIRVDSCVGSRNA